MSSLIEKSRSKQAQLVYAWESRVFPNWWDYPVLSVSQCQNEVDKLWDKYRKGAVYPKVRDGRGSPLGRGSRYSIELPRILRRLPAIGHEVCHSLLIDDTGCEYISEGSADHGPKFIELAFRIYADLLDCSPADIPPLLI